MAAGTSTRRKIWALAGAVVTTAALATAGGLPAAAATNTLPASQSFDLAAPVAKNPLAGLKLRRMLSPAQGPMQAFGFDATNRYLFVVQSCCYRSGGFHESATLTINRIPLFGRNKGRAIDSMTVPGAGHGSIGVVPAGKGRTQIWLEGKAAKTTYTVDRKKLVGYFGTQINSFIYTKNTPARPTLPKMTPHFVGSSHISATSDPIHHRLAFRYFNAKLKQFRVAVYDWNNVHDPQRLRVTLPTVPGTAQGFALYGHYYYVLTGSGGTRTAIVPIDLNKQSKAGVVTAGKPVYTAAFSKTLAGHSPEPQGLSPYQGADKRIGLFFGFSAHEKTSGPTVSTVTIGCKVGFNPHVTRAQPTSCPT